VFCVVVDIGGFEIYKLKIKSGKAREMGISGCRGRLCVLHNFSPQFFPSTLPSWGQKQKSPVAVICVVCRRKVASYRSFSSLNFTTPLTCTWLACESKIDVAVVVLLLGD
jgi:hypothetical protein